MSKDNSILSSPDEEGWYWFKKDKKENISVVFVNDDGEATMLNEYGESYLLTDLIGRWEKIESQKL